MLFKKSWRVSAGAITAVALLAACGGGTEGSDDAAGGDVELTVWMPTQEPTQKEAMDTVINGFEEENPGFTITLEERSIDAHKDQLRQVAGTSAGPDIYWYWEGPGLGGELVENAGMSLDLTEYYEEYGWDERFSEPALAGITQYGGYHGVPWTVQGEALYYNKALFEEAGITAEPQTYEELVAAADQLVDAGITPIQFGGTVNWHVMRLLDSLIETRCGAELGDQLNTLEASWAEEECVTEAFTDLKTWADSYFNEGFMGVSNDESTQQFWTGDAAMAYEGTWFNAQVAENGMDPEEVGIFKFPTGTGRLYGFGEGFYVNSSTDNPDEAAQFLDYATSTDVQAEITGAWSALSVNTEVEPPADNPLHALWGPIFDEAEGIYMNNDQNLSLENTTEYWRVQNSVLTGDLAPEDAGAEFQSFVDANQ